MKIKPHSNRKILRHEPLEDRHLLAVDLTNSFAGGTSSALLPQEELAVPQIATMVAANVEDSALIPSDIIEQEESTTLHAELHAEIAPVFFGPITYSEWLESQGETVVQSCTARPMTQEESGMLQTLTQCSIFCGMNPVSDARLGFDAPIVARADGTTYESIIDVYLWADDVNYTAFVPLGDAFVIGPKTMTGVANVENFANVVVATEGDRLWFTGTEEVGYGQITVTTSGPYKAIINVYSMRIIGYEIQERAWGDSWKTVEDRDKTEVTLPDNTKTEAGLWQLLWQENDYRWHPIMEDGIGAGKMGSTSFAAVNWNDRANSQASKTVFATGSRDASTGECWAYGTPPPGENAIIPTMTPYIVSSSYFDNLRNTRVSTSGKTNPTPTPMKWNAGTAANPSPKPATKERPRIGVTSVRSVYWQSIDSATNAIQLGNNPAANGGGQRCFPEKSSPDDSNAHDKILAVAALSTPIPVGMTGTVHVDWFDPDNPAGSTKSPTQNGPGERDNHGDFNIVNTTLTFASGTQQAWTTCTISPAHAGDNYIIAAHPNEGVVAKYRFQNDGKTLSRPNATGMTTLNTALRSDMLTVWRTLHVECDQMDYYYEPNTSCYIVTPPSPANYLGGMVTQQLARACIAIENITPSQNTQPPMGHDPLSFPELNAAAGGLGCGRDILINRTDYWTVRIVMASKFDLYNLNVVIGREKYEKGDFPAGFSLPGANIIFIFYQRLADIYPQSSSDLNTAIQRVLLHEIGHALTLGEGIDGAMKSPINNTEVLLPRYQKFLDNDIHNIQKESKIQS